jgi:hypothetical protein
MRPGALQGCCEKARRFRGKCATGAFKCRERRPSGRLLKTAKQTLGVPRLGLSPKTFVEKFRKGLILEYSNKLTEQDNKKNI